MRVLAIDPGPGESAMIVLDNKMGIEQKLYATNDHILGLLMLQPENVDLVAIEMIASYGMSVGQEVFETCVWVGMFMQATRLPVKRYTRKQIVVNLCGSARAGDSNVRQALIDKYGKQGTKKKPGPTFGIAKDMWSALAVADYALHRESACEMIKKALA